MKRIELEVVQKKRKQMLKHLQGKNIELNKNVGRKLADNGEALKDVLKRAYRKELAKLSDRFVPSLKNYG